MGKLNGEFHFFLEGGMCRRLSPLVLVVDDNAMCRRMAVSYLDGMGLDVREAENGLDALRLYASEGGADVIITDCDMPIRGGIELTQNIRDIQQNSAENKDPLIVMLSTHRDNVEEAKAAGVDVQLVKGDADTRENIRAVVSDYVRSLDAAAYPALAENCGANISFE